MDKYDQHIEKILDDPTTIMGDWTAAVDLFKLAGTPPEEWYIEDQGRPGCLTQIRRSPSSKAAIKGRFNEELTMQIHNDERLPDSKEDIKPTRECLNVFAEWQRKIDALNGVT